MNIEKQGIYKSEEKVRTLQDYTIGGNAIGGSGFGGALNMNTWNTTTSAMPQITYYSASTLK